MRLSAEVLNQAEQRPNPVGEREIILRGLAIPAIEHLGVTRDSFDSFDFSDNRLVRLENFSRLSRLSSLNCSGNLIESFDPNNLQRNVPNIKHLDLSYNQVSNLSEVANIGKAFTKIETLSLCGNPVTRRQHYRLYAILHIPSLKVLDYERVKRGERDRADRLAASAAGAALESDVRMESLKRHDDSTKTFVPGEGQSAKESFVAQFTQEQKEAIRLMVANAKSPEEIDEIERSIKRGVLPQLQGSSAQQDTIENSNARKRSADEELNGGDDAKKSKLNNGSSAEEG